MYKVVNVESFVDYEGKTRKPVASMECEVEGLVHVCEDDSCYIPYAK